ncbi:MAG: hypothetical protein GY909_01560 [Oligoflexia bacterium]|nr:hypothetical protein [Oligoflexia bacterium]
MIKILTYLLFLSCVQIYAAHVPPIEKNNQQARFKVNSFYKLTDWDTLVFKGDYFKVTDDRDEKSLTFEYRHRIHNNFKIGGYGTYLVGKRYDDDWVKSPTWKWADTQSRSEFLIGANVSYKKLISFVKNSIFELRYTNEHNSRNSHNHSILRPGFTKVFFNQGKALINYYFQYELIIPTNYSDETISEQWIYTGFTWHLSRRFKPGVFVQKGVGKWTTSDEYSRSHTDTYSQDHKYTVLGISLNIYL